MAIWSINLATICTLLSLSGVTSAATLNSAALAPNDLVITEYLANPIGVSDTLGEYFEIFNTTNFDVDLTGLIVRDDGSNSFTVSGAIVGARNFAVFSGSDGTSLGLTPDYVYGGSMSLTNTDDEIGLFRPDETLISKIAYTDGDFFGAGVAHELDLLGASMPDTLLGPTAGSDFVASATALALGNFGSPGSAGNTSINPPAIPLPGSAWMFGAALSILSWWKRKNSERKNARTIGASDEMRVDPDFVRRDYCSGLSPNVMGRLPC
jgi:hypothetical protein